MKRMYGVSLLCSLLLSAASTVLAATVNYGNLTTLNSVAWGQNVWVHDSARDWKLYQADANPANRSRRQANPNENCEPLVGASAGDARPTSAAALILLTHPDNKFSVDALEYGKEVKLTFVYVDRDTETEEEISATGLPVFVNESNRHSSTVMPPAELLVGGSFEANADRFVVLSPVGKTGKVMSGDTIQLASALNPSSYIVWANGLSVWGSDYKEILVGQPAAAVAGVSPLVEGDKNKSHFVLANATRTPENMAQYDEIIKMPVFTAEPVVPAGMQAEAGDVESISCGSRNGDPVLLGVNEERTALLRYDFKSMSDNPWVAVPLKKADGAAVNPDAVSVASDGTAVILDQLGVAHSVDFMTGIATPLPVGAGNEALMLDTIAVGSARHIYGVDIDSGTLYHHNGAGWVAVTRDVVTDVAVGVDGTVVALNQSGRAFMMDAAESTAAAYAWMPLQDENFRAIAVGSASQIFGIEKGSGTVYKWVNEEWLPLTNKMPSTDPATGAATSVDINSAGIEQIAVNAAGYLAIVTETSVVYDNGNPVGVEVVAQAVPAAAGQPAKTVVQVKPGKKAEERSKAKKEGKVKPKVKPEPKGRAEKDKAKKAKKGAGKAPVAKQKGAAVKDRKENAKKLKTEKTKGKKAAVKKEIKMSKKGQAKKEASKKKPKAKNVKKSPKKTKKPQGKGAAGKGAAGKSAGAKGAAGKGAATKQAGAKGAAGKGAADKSAGKKAAGKKAAVKQ